ncbi:MAG: FAD binding domain-containing protein [Proteobacteria bacterium]|nr:FAD binding domain-containing protein [Pseudomonadota bacterium]
MKPQAFAYHAPRGLNEAIALLARLDNAKLLAGGQSLVAMMNFRVVAPDAIVDLNGVAGLDGIAVGGERLRIGAMTRQRDIEVSPLIARHAPLFAAALAHVGHRQTRNRGTIGGSLAHADPAAELPAICAVHDAVVELAGPRGTRRVEARDFCTDFMTTAAAPEEIVTAIEMALPPRGHGFGFAEFARRHGDFALAGAAALVVLGAGGMVDRAAVVLFGVAHAPLRLAQAEEALRGRALTRAGILAAAAAARAITPIGDMHASADFRRHLVEVLLARALRDAALRIGVDVGGGA